MNVKDIAVRALKTFVQVFIVALPAGFIFSDVASAVVIAKSAGLSAAAAAVSVVMNALLQWSQS